jgi:hypothetical protein
MFTGELQPVHTAARSIAEAAEESYERVAPRKRRSRQRKTAAKLVQLSLMPELDAE